MFEHWLSTYLGVQKKKDQCRQLCDEEMLCMVPHACLCKYSCIDYNGCVFTAESVPLRSAAQGRGDPSRGTETTLVCCKLYSTMIKFFFAWELELRAAHNAIILVPSSEVNKKCSLQCFELSIPLEFAQTQKEFHLYSSSKAWKSLMKILGTENPFNS